MKEKNKRLAFERELQKERQKDLFSPLEIEQVTPSEFLSKFAKPVTDEDGNIVYLLGPTGNPTDHPSYLGSQNLEDLRWNPLAHVGIAYDPKTDRPPVWMKNGKKNIYSYVDNIQKDAHVQAIVLVDIPANIKSFENLLNKDHPNFIIFDGYQDEISSTIEYWQYFLDKGFKTFVLCGKNRSIFAWPIQVEEWVREDKLSEYDGITPIRVEIKRSLITEDHKGYIYNNEKANEPDSDYQKIMGIKCRMNDYIHECTDSEYKEFWQKTLTTDQIANSFDKTRELEIIAIDGGWYGSTIYSTAENFFKNDKAVARTARKLVEQVHEYFECLEVLYEEGEWTRFKGDKLGKPWWPIIARLIKDFTESGYDINLPTKEERMRKFVDVSLRARKNLDEKNEVYALGNHGANLKTQDLRQGFKSTNCTYKAGMISLTNDECKNRDIEQNKESGPQSDVYAYLQLEETKKILIEEKLLIKPVSRHFSDAEVNKVIKDSKQSENRHWCRISGTVVRKDGRHENFAEKYPDDPTLKFYQSTNDYILATASEVESSRFEIDHIKPYSQNRDKKNLDECELVTPAFNKFKGDDPLVDQDEVLSDKRNRKKALLS